MRFFPPHYFTILISVGLLCGSLPAARAEIANVQTDPAKVDTGKSERWNKLSPEQKQELRRRREALKNMDPQKRQELLKKYQHFRQLPPEKRAQIRKNVKRYKEMTPEERQKFKEHLEQWKKLSPEEKEKLKQKHAQLRKEQEGTANSASDEKSEK